MNPARLRAYIYLLIVAVIWGIAGPVIKLTLKGLPPDIFITYRFLISSIIAIPLFAMQHTRLPRGRSVLFQILLYSLLNSVISLGLLFWGTSRTSLLNMSLISLFGPLLMVSFGYFFLKDHVTSREKVGTIIAFIGAAFIVVGPLIKSNNGSGQLFGNLLIILSLSAGTFAGVLVKKLLRQGVSPDFLANISFIIGFIVLAPFTLLTNGFDNTISVIKNLPLIFHLGVFYMGIVSGNIAYTLNNMGQKTIELSEAAPFAYLYPIISAVMAIFLLGDRLTIPIMAGAIVTFAGVFLAEWKKKRYNS